MRYLIALIIGRFTFAAHFCAVVACVAGNDIGAAATGFVFLLFWLNVMAEDERKYPHLLTGNNE